MKVVRRNTGNRKWDYGAGKERRKGTVRITELYMQKLHGNLSSCNPRKKNRIKRS